WPASTRRSPAVVLPYSAAYRGRRISSPMAFYWFLLYWVGCSAGARQLQDGAESGPAPWRTGYAPYLWSKLRTRCFSPSYTVEEDFHGSLLLSRPSRYV